MVGKERMPKYWLPWLVGMPAETSLAICSMIFGGVFERFPSLRVAFAHGGGAFPITIGRIEHGFDVRPDLVAIENKISPRSYLARVDEHGESRPARFYVDSLVHDPDALRLLCKLFGLRARRARFRLSLSVRRSASGRADRIDGRFLSGRKSAAAERERTRVSWAAIKLARRAGGHRAVGAGQWAPIAIHVPRAFAEATARASPSRRGASTRTAGAIDLRAEPAAELGRTYERSSITCRYA